MGNLSENQSKQFFLKLKKSNSASVILRTLCLIAVVIASSSVGEITAQTKNVSLHLKNASVKEALEEIKNQTGYSVWFNTEDVALTKKITVAIRNKTVEQALDVVLKDQNLTYEVTGNAIRIRKLTADNSKQKTSFMLSGQMLGRDDNLPLIGGTVQVKGKNTAAVADVNGRYSISVQRGDVLIFSYIGYESYEYTVANKPVQDVYLLDKSIALGDVVITGYQTLSKFNSTGAVSTISNKTIDARSSVGLQGILEGTVSGLTVYNNDYRIRGGASLNAGTKPLFIVDDFEVEALPENMDIVETITVLKDAAATAIWGSRASNGVVVITTKKGKSNDFRISYSGNFSVSAKPDYGDLYRANAEQLIDYEKDVYKNKYIFPEMYAGSKYGYSQSYEIFLDHARGTITEEEMNARLANLSKYSNTQQIKDKLLQNPFKQNHMLSISGGSDKVNYFLSGSFSGSNTSYAGNSEKWGNINSRTSYKVLPSFTLRSDINASFSQSNKGYGGLESDIYNLWPYQMLLDENNQLVYDYSEFNKGEALRLQKMGFLSQGKNLLEEVNLANQRENSTFYKVRVGGDLKILKGVNFSTDFQYEKTLSTDKNIRSQGTYYTRNLINYMTEIGQNGKIINHLPYGDILDHNQSSVNAWILKTGITLNRTFGADNKHYVNAIAGFEMRKRNFKSESYRKFAYDDQLLSWKPIDQVKLSEDGIQWWNGRYNYYDATTDDSFNEIENREISTFGSVVYTYDNRYSISASLRVDESNLFGASKKYRRNPIWSIGANWNVANEEFFQSDIINNLTLRSSIGLTGNFDRSGRTTPVMIARRLYLSSVGDYVTRIVSPPNPLLRWERNRSVNTSVDIGLWNRIDASVTYYHNYAYDLLGETNLDPTTGYSKSAVNAADMRNAGIEVQLNADLVRTRDFTWNVNWIFAYNKNKILNNKVSDEEAYLNRTTGTTKFVEGYARESIWSFNWAGLDDKGNPQAFDAKGNKTRDISNFSAEDLVWSGTSQPVCNGSFSTGIRYKSFQINTLFTYNFGHVFRVEYPDMNAWSSTPATNKLIADRWRKPGDELITDIPSITTMQDYYAYFYREYITQKSSNSIRDGGMVRLREILLSYEMPTSLIARTPIRRLALTLQANNLWLWTKNKEGYDPEAVSPVSGKFSLRTPVSFTAGVKIDF